MIYTDLCILIPLCSVLGRSDCIDSALIYAYSMEEGRLTSHGSTLNSEIALPWFNKFKGIYYKVNINNSACSITEKICH